jgi:hypothetical protein
MCYSRSCIRSGHRNHPIERCFLRGGQFPELVTEELRRPVPDPSQGIQIQNPERGSSWMRLAEIECHILIAECFLGYTPLEPAQQMLAVALHDDLNASLRLGID